MRRGVIYAFLATALLTTGCNTTQNPSPDKKVDLIPEQPAVVEKAVAPEVKPAAKPVRKAEVFAISESATKLSFSEASGVASASGLLRPGAALDFLLPVSSSIDMDVTLTCTSQDATFMVYTMDGKELMPMPSTMWFGASPVDGELLIRVKMASQGTSVDFQLDAQPL